MINYFISNDFKINRSYVYESIIKGDEPIKNNISSEHVGY